MVLEEIEEQNQQRPQLLTVLCVLTFIGSGSSLLANSVLYIVRDEVKRAYDEGAFEMFSSTLQMEYIELMLGVNPIFFLAQAALYGVSLFGAYKMWHMKKIGFHIYTMAQLTLIIVFNLFMTSLPFPFFAAFVSLTFILLYLRNLRIMH